jgi:hypothetical protein
MLKTGLQEAGVENCLHHLCVLHNAGKHLPIGPSGRSSLQSTFLPSFVDRDHPHACYVAQLSPTAWINYKQLTFLWSPPPHQQVPQTPRVHLPCG